MKKENKKNNELHEINNNFCRNCGSKMGNVQYCPNCGTRIIDKRVNNDKKYIYYVLANFLCIILGILGIPIAFIVAIVIAIIARDKYRGKLLIEFMFWIEIILLIFALTYTVIIVLFCATATRDCLGSVHE